MKLNNSVTVSPQVLCSSEPSTQSTSPSQTNPREMHSPLVTHLNSCVLHVVSGTAKSPRVYVRIYT